MARDPYTRFQQAFQGLKRGRLQPRPQAPAPKPVPRKKQEPLVPVMSQPLARTQPAPAPVSQPASVARQAASTAAQPQGSPMLDSLSFGWEPEIKW